MIETNHNTIPPGEKQRQVVSPAAAKTALSDALHRHGRRPAAAKKQGSSMQQKLVLYWICMVLVLFSGFMLLVSFVGVFSHTESKAAEALKLQQENNVAAVAGQLELLKSSCVKLSEQTSRELNNVLRRHGLSFAQLNDAPELLTELQERLYGLVSTTMSVGRCSGAFVVLDVTTNSRAAGAASSRSGVYLRTANLSSAKQALQDITYFRGIPDVARRQNIRFCTSWNLEFDISKMPGYDELLHRPVKRLADSCFLSEKISVPGTWEEAMLLLIPFLDSAGQVRGLCGVEISELYFRLSYPAFDSRYGSMIPVFAPQTPQGLRLSAGFWGRGRGELSLGLPREADVCAVPQGKKSRLYDRYALGEKTYIGLSTALSVHCLGGDTAKEMQLVTLLPFEGLHSRVAAERMSYILFSLFFLLVMLLLSVFLSKRFVKPIVSGLKMIREGQEARWEQSGITELDELLAFMREHPNQSISAREVPEDIMELFNRFVERSATLSDAEFKIFKYYAEGRSIQEIPELLFISMPTVRKHNRSIYEKLGVASKDEMMLILDLLRRCGKIDEIFPPEG